MVFCHLLVSTALQVDRMAQQMEASERSMQDRIQRLEAIRLSLDEVRKSALGMFEHCYSSAQRRLPGKLCCVSECRPL